MSVAYLDGGEEKVAQYLESLYVEFDGKFNSILLGRSPVVAFNVGVNGISNDLLGRCFFFVDSTAPSRWAFRCPDAKVISGRAGIDPIGGLAKANIADAVVRGYDHKVFTDAVAAAVPVSWDEARRIVTVQDFAAGRYAGTGWSPILNTGLLDHSLEAHTLTRTDGTNETNGKYFIREASVEHAERKYRYAVAEIILEGVTKVSIPETFNKYACFRIHNLNLAKATVHFPGLVVQLQGLGCRTVRRITTEGTEVTEWKLQDLTYFWDFRGGEDYRHYAFFASSWYLDLHRTRNIMYHDQPTPMNGTCASNLANPSVIYDWVNALKYDHQAFAIEQKRYAWFHQDVHELRDEYGKYGSNQLGSNQFLGNPAVTSTKLGDLIHHKGKMLLVKFHKRDHLFLSGVDTGYPDVRTEEIEFKGYATVVADFAAHGVSVTTDANGTLLFKAPVDADWEWNLMPYGTNLFKIGESLPTLLRLYDNVAYPAETAVFDNQATVPVLTPYGPQVVVTRDVSETANARTYVKEETFATVQVVGSATRTLVTTNPPFSGRTQMFAVQNVSVADILSLAMFGNKNLGSQNTTWTQYVDASLVLTPFGLVLKFTERIPFDVFQTAELASLISQGWELSGSGVNAALQRKRVISWRGHGFGYAEGGRATALWTAPRYGRFTMKRTYKDRILGTNGADYSVDSPFGVEETAVTLLQRLRADIGGLGDLRNGERSNRFWFGLWPDGFLEATARMNDGDMFKLWLGANRTTLLQGGPAGGANVTLGLLPEHYNGMAQVVNSLTEGKALDFRCLRWVVTYQGTTYSVGLDLLHDKEYPGFWVGDGDLVPVPADCFDYRFEGRVGQVAEEGLRRFALYAAAGIPIYQEMDLPGFRNDVGVTGWVNVRNKDRTTRVNAQVVISNSLTFQNDGHQPADGAIATNSRGQQSEWIFSDIEITVTHSSSYANSARASGTALFPNRGFARLLDTYAGFRWVKLADVHAFLDLFGFESTVDEYFVPYELRLVKCGTKAKHGEYHKGTHKYIQRPTFQEVPFGRNNSQPGANGTFNVPMDFFEPDVECLAFYPSEDAGKAIWKWPCSFTFNEQENFARVPSVVIRDTKFWNGVSPAELFGPITPVFHIEPAFIDTPGYDVREVGISLIDLVGSLGNGYEWQGSGTSVGNYRAYVNSVDGPYLHIEWAGNDESEQAEHDRWLKLNWGIFYASFAFRSAQTDGVVETKPIFFVHKGFWAEELNYFRGRKERLFRAPLNRAYQYGATQSGVFGVQNPASGGILPWHAFSRSTSLDLSIVERSVFPVENPWVWREKNVQQNRWGPATLAPAIEPGLNVFTAPVPDVTNEFYGLEYKGVVVSGWTRVKL